MNIGKETEMIEFKKSTSLKKEGMISICSILNKHGKGTLYFGVKDNGDIVGQQIGRETLRDISKEIIKSINPRIWAEVKENKSIDDLTFIQVDFYGDNAPYSAYGRYYNRIHDEDILMTNLQLEQFFSLKEVDYSKWENDNSGKMILSTNEHLVLNSINNGIEKGRINIKYDCVKTILSKLELMYNESFLNNAGYYMFSNEKPIVLKLAKFASSTKETFLDLQHFEGNIFECIEKAIEYIRDGIDWRVEFNGSPQRKEIPEIPIIAIREIIVNAFAHAKYKSNTTFEVNIYKDKVTIYNPGEFPRGFVPEDFAFNRATPIMMNPKIIKTLYKCNEIESYASGFERVFRSCREYGVDYYYDNSILGFQFTFVRFNNAGGNQLSEIDIKILLLLEKDPTLITEDIAKKINKSTKTVYRGFRKLKEEGYIVREGTSKHGNWIVLKTFSKRSSQQ